MLDLLASVPGVTPLMFVGFTALAFFTAAFGIVAGLGGGVLLIGVMATIFPPAASAATWSSRCRRDRCR